MARLIYGMIMSLDGYTEDERGAFGWGAPDDEGVQSYLNELHRKESTELARRVSVRARRGPATLY